MSPSRRLTQPPPPPAITALDHYTALKNRLTKMLGSEGIQVSNVQIIAGVGIQVMITGWLQPKTPSNSNSK